MIGYVNDANTNLNLANSEVKQLVKQLKDANRDNAGPFSKEIANVTEARVVAELLFSMATKAQLEGRLLAKRPHSLDELEERVKIISDGIKPN